MGRTAVLAGTLVIILLLIGLTIAGGGRAATSTRWGWW